MTNITKSILECIDHPITAKTIDELNNSDNLGNTIDEIMDWINLKLNYPILTRDSIISIVENLGKDGILEYPIIDGHIRRKGISKGIGFIEPRKN